MARPLKSTAPDKIVCAGEAELTLTLVERFLRACSDAIEKRSRFTFLLSGGKSPESFYRRLAGPDLQARLDWRKIHLFWGDERFVPPADSESNFGNAQARLISKIDIPPGNVHPVPTSEKSPEAAADRYESEMRRFFDLSGGAFPAFDFILLGVGEDGHVASLFPGMRQLDELHRWVVPVLSVHLKTRRISVTLPVINSGREIVVLAAGNRKTNIVREIFRVDSSRGLPVQRLDPVSGKLIFLLDKASAASL